MSKPSLIIIGAGLAGLSAGVYARMRGYPARIIEHQSHPGGVAQTWRRGEYLFDGGIHFIMGHRPGHPLHGLYRDLGVIPGTGMITLATYGRFVDEQRGRGMTVTRDLDRLVAQVSDASPDDARLMSRLVAGARAIGKAGMEDLGMDGPPELAGPLDGLRALWHMRRVMRWFGGPFGRPVREWAGRFRDPWVGAMTERLFLPEVPVWFLMMLLGLLEQGQMGLLAGGSSDFVRPIEERFRALGGSVLYDATVREILVENDRAVGVRLADGGSHRADVVVSAADGHSTVFELLGGRYVDKATRRRFETWPVFRPVVMISLGIARTFADEPWLSLIVLERPIRIGGREVHDLSLRLFNYSDRFAPAGRTAVQVLIETEWEYWEDLARDRPRYDAEKQRIAAEVVNRLEVHYPGIAASVEETDIATPHTLWRYTRNYRGAYEGWLPTPKAIMTPVRRTLPGLAGFYMAGQWVIPGGGVPPCLHSGRQVVQLLEAREGKAATSRG